MSGTIVNVIIIKYKNQQLRPHFYNSTFYFVQKFMRNLNTQSIKLVVFSSSVCLSYMMLMTDVITKPLPSNKKHKIFYFELFFSSAAVSTCFSV